MAAPPGDGDPPTQASAQPLGRSFAAVIKGRPEHLPSAVKLAPRQYGLKEGKPSITFTQTELQPGIQRLQHSLVAKFSSGRPPIDDVRRQLTQAWGLDIPVTIGALDARHVLIILPNAPLANRLLAHPTRKVGNYLFRLFRWSQGFRRNKEPSMTTTWIKLPGLPTELFDAGYIEAIVSPIGRFLAIDEGTRTCRNPSFARACIELDLHNPVPADIWIDLGCAGGFWQPLTFESNLFYCTHCKLHGHRLENCRKQRAPGTGSGDQQALAVKEKMICGQGQQQPRRTEEEHQIPKARDHEPPDKPYALPDQPYTRTAMEMSKTQNAASSALKVLSLSEQISRSPDIEDEAWTLVQKRKQKQKQKVGQRFSPTLKSKFEQKAISPRLLTNEPHSSCQRPPPADNGVEEVLPASPLSVVPHASTLRSTRGLDNISNKLSACIIYKRRPKGEPIPINSPRRAGMRSPTISGFLSPSLLCLPIRDVHHSSPV